MEDAELQKTESNQTTETGTTDRLVGESGTKEYYAIIKNWQVGIMRINLMLIILMFVIEIVFMFILDATGEISVPIRQYIPRYILRPSLVNAVVYGVLYYAFKSPQVRNSFRAMIPLILLTVVLSNMLVVHYVFPAVYMVLIVPLFISTIYGSLRISRTLFIILMPVYALSIIQVILTPYYILPDAFWYNVVIGFVGIPLSYLLVRNIVLYENEKENLVDRQYRTNQELQKEALYDGLTGILNHTGLFKILEEKIKEFASGKTLFLAVLDIDFFKKVNDDFGHEAGNQVLARLGNMMNDYANDNVHVARYGGEEFCVVFSDMKDYEALRLLKDMHKEFQSYSYPDINRRVTFSAGIAAYKEGLSVNSFVEKADQALYLAKNSGRNRVESVDV